MGIWLLSGYSFVLHLCSFVIWTPLQRLDLTSCGLFSRLSYYEQRISPSYFQFRRRVTTMHLSNRRVWLPALLALDAVSTATAGRGIRHTGKTNELISSYARASIYNNHSFSGMDETIERRAKPQFLSSFTSSKPYSVSTTHSLSMRVWASSPNDRSTGFAVNGSGIPDVKFDIGESYAGSLPLSSDSNDNNQLFFWFFPSTNPSASKEIVIWLNGGVSSYNLTHTFAYRPTD